MPGFFPLQFSDRKRLFTTNASVQSFSRQLTKRVKKLQKAPKFVENKVKGYDCICSDQELQTNHFQKLNVPEFAFLAILTRTNDSISHRLKNFAPLQMTIRTFALCTSGFKNVVMILRFYTFQMHSHDL